jgi:drug/metabolite transporter (DMT)-like permease
VGGDRGLVIGGQLLGYLACLAAAACYGIGYPYTRRFLAGRRAGAQIASTVTYLIPVFSTVLGVVVLGEALSWNQPVGAAVVLLGVALTQGRLSRPRSG